jgi:polar amino acid transport system permease protein
MLFWYLNFTFYTFKVCATRRYPRRIGRRSPHYPYAAYLTEVLRAGVEAVPLAQIELGKSIGLSDWQLLRHVILPQAGILSLPALFANFIFLLKETTVVSAVLTLICVLLFLPLSLLLSRLERRLQHGQFGS